ncbi:MAG: hypothetical protein ABI887_15960 [Burkholderiales bacterium]
MWGLRPVTQMFALWIMTPIEQFLPSIAAPLVRWAIQHRLAPAKRPKRCARMLLARVR